MGASRARLARLAASALALFAAAPFSARAEPDLELAVKATYLYKLAPFVSWPDSAFPAPNSPLTICVQGSDPFGSVLDRAAGGQSVGSHPIIVRRTPRVEAASGCQIAYLAGGPAQSPAQALQALAGAGTLTVTDEARGAAHGAVHLVLDKGRVRFAVDAVQAQANGLTLSSKLLALAVGVRR